MDLFTFKCWPYYMFPSAPVQATYTTIPPVESITFGMPTRAITAFVGTHTPGETPPIAGAPVLPPTREYSPHLTETRINATSPAFQFSSAAGLPRTKSLPQVDTEETFVLVLDVHSLHTADSPQVKQWMKELEGHDIPDLAPTKDSTCAGDPEAAAQAAERGWWTCGGHTRSTGASSYVEIWGKRVFLTCRRYCILPHQA